MFSSAGNNNQGRRNPKGSCKRLQSVGRRGRAHGVRDLSERGICGAALHRFFSGLGFTVHFFILCITCAIAQTVGLWQCVARASL
jgi:hypothetical protein